MASIDSRSPRDTTVAILKTDEQTARRIAGLFAESFTAGELAVSLVDAGRGNWSVTVYFGAAVDQAAVRDLAAAAGGVEVSGALRFARVAAKDWIGDTLAGLTPVTAGRFVVHGAHDRACIAVNRIGIEIEAALAFGTGHHGTTRGCLLALDRIFKSADKHRRIVRRHPEVRAISAPRRMNGRSARAVALRGPLRGHLRVTGRGSSRILDLGTGSGVLAIAAARAWRGRVLAADIDAAAVRAARDNARRNRVGAMVAVVRADGVAAAAIRSQAPFDLVCANILLEPLQRAAAALTELVSPGGRVVLSGLLAAQANAALAAYRPLALERRIDLDGWTTLVLRRGKAATRTRHVPLPLVGRG